MRSRLLLLGLVPLLGLVELGLHQYFATRAPGFDDYAALAPELLKLKQPGIPVVVSPRWAEPLVRQAAPAAFPFVELTRSDDTAFALFLEVSLLGATAPELAALPVRNRRQVGPFTLLLRDNPRFEEARFDFVTAVDTGEVEVFNEVGRERRGCPIVERRQAATGGLHGPVARPSRHYECPQGRVVAVTLIEDEQYRPHRCILVDPPASGRIVLRFSSVPATERLMGFAGFSYFLGRDYEAEAAELRITDGTGQLAAYRAQPSEGWRRFERQRAQPGAVEVNVTRAAAEPGDFCFAMEAR